MGSNHSLKKSKERKTKSKTADLETLQNIRDARLVEYGKSKNTNKAYAGHISQGRKFLDDIVAERELKGIDICDKGIPTNELAKLSTSHQTITLLSHLNSFLFRKFSQRSCRKAMWKESKEHLQTTGIKCEC